MTLPPAKRLRTCTRGSPSRSALGVPVSPGGAAQSHSGARARRDEPSASAEGGGGSAPRRVRAPTGGSPEAARPGLPSHRAAGNRWLCQDGARAAGVGGRPSRRFHTPPPPAVDSASRSQEAGGGRGARFSPPASPTRAAAGGGGRAGVGVPSASRG
ncbi:hypothetical protein VULLAG_LOCUS11699 [Vulpes lagopus]